ncbi:MAG: Holliday junction branch migration DNA helicase RuvB, partial [Promicromonosporaceae bacterium]|nr:Holliday junction branch migration DNA helicase RuvB [Promicromonosporaceae bacterium]
LNELSKRSRGTPRVANRLLKRVRDFAQVRGEGIIDRGVTDRALSALGIDEKGLEGLDRDILRLIINNFGGGPVGLNTLALTVGEEADTVETVSEPYLVREGYITRSPRGRIATAQAWQHLGLAVPAGTVDSGSSGGRFAGGPTLFDAEP